MATFVLVHGSFHGAWCWQRLVPLLEAAGHTVSVPELPAGGNLASYAKRVGDAVEAADEPVILVGHSMGAIVSSQVAETHADKLSALVPVCGLLLRSGETLASFLGEFAHLGIEDQVLAHMQVSADGSVASFPAEHAREVFYHRCNAADADWAASRLRPQATAVYADPTQLTDAGFGRVRRFYIEGLDDHAVALAYQRLMTERTPCEIVYSLDTDHSPFLSAPRKLLGVLEDIRARVAR
jgi:pimeloyl-ACP methyl ester carboxylesterase